MDPLTQTIALLRPQGLLWKQAEARGDWAVRYPANKGAVFCLVASGGCVFQMPGRGPSSLQAGDFLLLTAPPEWTLGSRDAVTPIDFVKAHSHTGVVDRKLGDTQSGPATKLVGGHFWFDDVNTRCWKICCPQSSKSDLTIPTQQGCAAYSTFSAAKQHRTGRDEA